MKILFVMPDLRAGGGLARSTLDLLLALRALGAEPSVACLWDPTPSMREEFQRYGIAVTVLDGDAKAKIRPLRRIIQDGGIDVVHTARSLPSTVGRLASIGLPIALVTSIINVPEPLGRIKAALAYRWTNRLTDRFHAVSFAAKSYATLKLGVPAQRITVIERGRDLGRLGAPGIKRRLRARAALGIDRGAYVILAVGRQEPQKDHVTLLAAFERIAPLHTEALLVIVGREGNSTPLLLRGRELSAHSDRVRILGYREDVPDVLAAADVFALPSAWEGLPGTALEAMALGLPVVASDIPPLREVVVEGLTGMLAPPHDPDAFARALSGLLQDPERARSLGAMGRHRFMERFTIERSAERMLDLYVRLLPPEL